MYATVGALFTIGIPALPTPGSGTTDLSAVSPEYPNGPGFIALIPFRGSIAAMRPLGTPLEVMLTAANITPSDHVGAGIGASSAKFKSLGVPAAPRGFMVNPSNSLTTHSTRVFGASGRPGVARCGNARTATIVPSESS